jgi:multicomponent Na+:H+ antiporter subunit G
VAEIIGYGLMLFGAVFIFVAAVGPACACRICSCGCTPTPSRPPWVSAALCWGQPLYFGEITVLRARAMAVVIFLFITAPISAHLLARAAYFSGIPLWDNDFE